MHRNIDMVADMSLHMLTLTGKHGMVCKIQGNWAQVYRPCPVCTRGVNKRAICSCLSERDMFAAILSILIIWSPINASVTVTMTNEVVKKLPNLASLTTRTNDSYRLCCSFSSSVGSS